MARRPPEDREIQVIIIYYSNKKYFIRIFIYL